MTRKMHWEKNAHKIVVVQSAVIYAQHNKIDDCCVYVSPTSVMIIPPKPQREFFTTRGYLQVEGCFFSKLYNWEARDSCVVCQYFS